MLRLVLICATAAALGIELGGREALLGSVGAFLVSILVRR